jgi:hypothetical protein
VLSIRQRRVASQSQAAEVTLLRLSGEQVRSLVEIIQTGVGPPKRTVSLAGTTGSIRPWSVLDTVAI